MQNLIIIKTLEELKSLRDYLTDKQFIAYDVESTGVDKDSEIIGFSVCADSETAYYVITQAWDKGNQTLIPTEAKGHERIVIDALVGKDLIMHNAVFDCFMTFNNYGIQLIQDVHTDTMLAAHLLDENRPCGLKELGTILFGESSKDEQAKMKESIAANGGQLTKKCYELYKGDADLIALYGAKDAILTYNLFLVFSEQLVEQGLDGFFYDDETMPLLRTATYQLNTTGLKVDLDALLTLQKTLEAEILEAEAFIRAETAQHVKDKYPATNKSNHFNVGSTQQLSWLLFEQLENDFFVLTDAGKQLCRALQLPLPYAKKDKRQFIQSCKQNLGMVYEREGFNTKTKRKTLAKKVKDPWVYMSCGKDSLKKLSAKYKWVEKLLKLNQNKKLLSTYVKGIQERQRYNIIRPSFLQHGTTSGRYSSRNPNFQNLPRDDKRIKACIVSRPGKVFVGADYSQLEPRVFASFSGDAALQASFASGQDFYSVIGMRVFNKYDATPYKEGSPEAFGVKYKKLRDISKAVALSATYGTTAPKMAPLIDKTMDEAQEVIDDYFDAFPDVLKMMEASYETAKKDGQVTNLFGRPRRLPEALKFKAIYGSTPHARLPYEARTVLNLSVNHRIQSTGASIMNRATIAFIRLLAEAKIEAKVVMQVHDSLIAECAEEDGSAVSDLMQYAMQETVILPGVILEAVPKIGKSLVEV